MKRLLLLLALLCYPAAAQDQTHYFAPIAGAGQFLKGPSAPNDGAIGMGAVKGDGGFKVIFLLSTGPAARAGIQMGDFIAAVDDKSVAAMSEDSFDALLSKKPGESYKIVFLRSGKPTEVVISVEPRNKVYTDDSKAAPSAAQRVFGGHAVLTAALSHTPSKPQAVMLWLMLSNLDAPASSIDDLKCFVLDSQGQPLRHMSLGEVKYAIQSWLAQNSHGGSYPPTMTPAPQPRYVISSGENGNYTLGEAVSGSDTAADSSPSSPKDQPDYSRLAFILGFSLEMAMHAHSDAKYNELTVKQAQQTMAQWDALYVKTQTPVNPGENKGGGILYWTGSDRDAAAPFKVVVFLTDPATHKQETVQFAFH